MAMDEAELNALHARVEAELMKIAGVVGVGLKEEEEVPCGAS